MSVISIFSISNSVFKIPFPRGSIRLEILCYRAISLPHEKNVYPFKLRAFWDAKFYSLLVSVADLRLGGCWFNPRLGQYSFKDWWVIAPGFIPLSPLSVVSTMVMWESSQWLGKNIVLNSIGSKNSGNTCIGNHCRQPQYNWNTVENSIKHHTINQLAFGDKKFNPLPHNPISVTLTERDFENIVEKEENAGNQCELSSFIHDVFYPIQESCHNFKILEFLSRNVFNLVSVVVLWRVICDLNE